MPHRSARLAQLQVKKSEATAGTPKHHAGAARFQRHGCQVSHLQVAGTAEAAERCSANIKVPRYCTFSRSHAAR